MAGRSWSSLASPKAARSIQSISTSTKNALTIPIVPIGGVDQLFAAFEFFGNAAADIIRAFEPPLT